mgnify:CR=1 FL=1
MTYLLFLFMSFMNILSVNAQTSYAVYTGDDNRLTFYHDGKKSSRSGVVMELNDLDNQPEWNSYSDKITSVVFDSSFANARPSCTYRWFSGMSNLISITGIEYLNTSDVTVMTNMFSGCRGLKSINVSSFDTGNVTNMSGMFSDCSGLTSIDVGKFNTSKVLLLFGMFSHCSSLTSINVSSFDTSNVIDMSSMFLRCSSLTSIDLSNFNTESTLKSRSARPH